MAVAFVCFLAFFGKTFDCLYRIVRRHLPGVHLGDYLHDHLGQLFFTLVVVAIFLLSLMLLLFLPLVLVILAFVFVLSLLMMLGCFEQFLDLFQALVRVDLALFHLVHNATELFQQVNLVGVTFCELYRIDDFSRLDDGIGVRRSILEQVVKPPSL